MIVQQIGDWTYCVEGETRYWIDERGYRYDHAVVCKVLKLFDSRIKHGGYARQADGSFGTPFWRGNDEARFKIITGSESFAKAVRFFQLHSSLHREHLAAMLKDQRSSF